MFILKVLVIASIAIYVKADEDTSTVLQTAINYFSNRFYKEIADLEYGKSRFVSGFSASTVLALLSMGAKGETQNELYTALGFSNRLFVESAFQCALQRMNNITGITLSVANKAYVQDFPDLHFHRDFVQKAVDIFYSEIEKINFKDIENAITTINTWIENKTNNKIKDMLKPDSLNSDTIIVLVNAIYFKGLWESAFDPKLTKPHNFNLDAKSKVRVDMMQREGSYGLFYKNNWEATAIEIPYKENQASMVIILPDHVEGLAEIEKKMSTSDLKRDIFDNLLKSDIILKMPKFKIETEIDLMKILPKIGIKLIFSSYADLSGILNSNDPLHVSTALQKAYVDVNEEGTEAAAVTTIGLSRTTSIRFTPTIVCDRPFIFFIKLVSGEILFTGRFTGSDITNEAIQDIEDNSVIQHKNEIPDEPVVSPINDEPQHRSNNLHEEMPRDDFPSKIKISEIEEPQTVISRKPDIIHNEMPQHIVPSKTEEPENEKPLPVISYKPEEIARPYVPSKIESSERDQPIIINVNVNVQATNVNSQPAISPDDKCPQPGGKKSPPGLGNRKGRCNKKFQSGCNDSSKFSNGKNKNKKSRGKGKNKNKACSSEE